MELLSQQDKKWKGEKLGKSKWTIGNAGCVITSLCNCHNLAGNNITPDELNRMLTDIGGYTKDGDLYWSCAEKILGCRILHNAWLKDKHGLNTINDILSQRIDANHHIICRYLYKGTQHFTNILNVFLNQIVIYNVYSGQTEVIYKSDVNRLVVVNYKI